MQIPTRFTIGVHALLLIALQGESTRVTSEYIASSVGVNPVVIRRILSQLRATDMITINRGVGGAMLAKPPADISLLDIYLATDSQGEQGLLFNFHNQINPNCTIGQSMHKILDQRLLSAQQALEAELAKQTMADLMKEALQ